MLCVTAQSANLKTWSKERIPSLLEVSAKLKTKSPASEILEMLMKISHNIHLDLDNDKDKQEEIRMDCETETKTLDELIKYAETDAMLNLKLRNKNVN